MGMWLGMIPTLDFSAGETSPGQLPPTSRGSATVSWMKAVARTMSSTGMPSVIATTRPTPASAASMMASAANGGGTKTAAVLAPASSTASATVLKTGTPRWVVPPLPGLTPATTLVPNACICSVWKVPSRPVMPWTTGRVGGAMRVLTPAPLRGCSRRRPGASQLDRLGGRLGSADPRGDAGVGQEPAAFLLGGAGHAHHQGNPDAELVASGDDASGDLVPAGGPAADGDEDRLDAGVLEDHVEAVAHHFGFGAATDVEKVGRLAARGFDQVEGVHDQAGPVAEG